MIGLFRISLFLFVTNCFSQSLDTIHGRLFRYEGLIKQFGEIYMSEKGSFDKVIVDRGGYFKFVPNRKDSVYTLVFSISNLASEEYKFKSEWSKRRKPKSIIINVDCVISKKAAELDWKNNKATLIYYSQDKISRRDRKFEKKFNVKYFTLSPLANEAPYISGYRCAKIYNKQILHQMSLIYGDKFKRIIRKDVLGVE